MVRARQAAALVAERSGPMGRGIDLDDCARPLAAPGPGGHHPQRPRSTAGPRGLGPAPGDRPHQPGTVANCRGGTGRARGRRAHRPVLAAGAWRARLRAADRLAPRPDPPAPRTAGALEPGGLPRCQRGRRPQGHLGTEPAPAPGDAGTGVPADRRGPLRGRRRGTAARLDGYQPTQARDQLGEQPGDLVSQHCLVLDAASAARPSRAVGPHGRVGPCLPGAQRPAHRVVPVDVFRPQHAPDRRGARAPVHRLRLARTA